jgi:hypothetical protein
MIPEHTFEYLENPNPPRGQVKLTVTMVFKDDIPPLAVQHTVDRREWSIHKEFVKQSVVHALQIEWKKRN